MISPLLALFAWIPISLYFFWRYELRTAILINFLGGWALLPGANYVSTSASLPYWILPSSLPSAYFITKATITGFSGLLGARLADKNLYRKFQLTFWDLPMVIWCVVPLFSAIANSQDPSIAVLSTAYQSLAWGVPYFLGRVYFSDTDSLRLAAIAFVIAGLAYVPICLVEIWTGPQIYAHLYGYEPYRWVSAHRYIGYRPVGLLENGNQLGIWMATSALIAGWLWKRRSVERILRLPIGWVTILLFVVAVLCQSGGSILLLICLLPFVFVSQHHLPRVVTVVLVIGILAFAAFRLTNIVPLQTFVRRNAAVHGTAHFLKEIRRGSLGWRLSLDEKQAGTALANPLLGAGDWDWWKSGSLRPWGLWLLAFGMYGIVGLGALECIQLLPVARVVWFPLARSDIQAFNLRHALAAAILMSAIDNLLNSAMILPLLLVIGGMSTWTSAASGLQPEIQELPQAVIQHPTAAR